MAEEERIWAGTPVKFEVGIGVSREGEVHLQFPDKLGLNYILQYGSDDNLFYVVRRKGQFKITGEAPWRASR
jgi:hypothetical protein